MRLTNEELIERLKKLPDSLIRKDVSVDTEKGEAECFLRTGNMNLKSIAFAKKGKRDITISELSVEAQEDAYNKLVQLLDVADSLMPIVDSFLCEKYFEFDGEDNLICILTKGELKVRGLGIAEGLEFDTNMLVLMREAECNAYANLIKAIFAADFLMSKV